MQQNTEDLISIKEWIAKEPHLPKDLDDYTLQKFIHSCEGSLERTKQRLDRFCCSRSRFLEVYSSRDPLLPHLQRAFAVGVATNYEYGKKEIIVHKYDDPLYEHFSFMDMLTVLSMMCDHWIKYRSFIADGHYLILDLSHWTLKMLTDANLAYFKQFLVYLVKAMPARPINIFCVNSPPFYEKLSVILKPMLPTSIRDKLFIFTDYESLYSYIDRKYLPVEYGGEAQSLHEKNKTLVKQIEEDREFFLNDDLWKANLSLKPDYTEADNELKGSFRALIID